MAIFTPKRRLSFVRIAIITAVGGLALALTVNASAGSGYAFIGSVSTFFGMAPTAAPVRSSGPKRLREVATNQPLLAPAPQPMFFSGTITLVSLGSTYSQDFSGLASTGTTSSTVPTGWDFSEAGGNTLYTVGTGSGTAGDTYSFGVALSPERAFGGLQSGTVIPTIGAQFTNSTGSTISALLIGYTGEEWRLGTAGRTDQLTFEYSTNATSLTTGTWTGVTALNFVTPVTTVTGAKDGNAAANRTVISPVTISGLNIASGSTVWIRWTDVDATSSDDGLAVDDFTLRSFALITPTTSAATGVTASGATMNGDDLGTGGGLVSDRGLYWKLGTGVTTANGTKISVGSGTGSISSTLSGLSSGTEYSYIAYAVNEAGTGVSSPETTFTTAAAAPAVTGISPASGSTAGANSVTITGTDLTGATAVKFGATAATGLTSNTATSITVTAPAHAAGVVDVTVVTPGGTSAITAADQYTYVATLYRSVATGIWDSNGTWEQSTDGGTTWVAAMSNPNGSSGKVTVRSPNTVTISLAHGTLGQITVDSGATLVNNGISTSIADGPGTDLDVNGTLLVNGPGGRFSSSGSSSFSLNAGATLGISDPAGITASAATGSIRMTTRSFSPAANYVYSGVSNQVTGDGLPSSVSNLTIANTGTSPNNVVFLSQAVAVTGTLSVAPSVASVLDLASFTTNTAANLTLGGLGRINGTWGGTASASAFKNSAYFGSTATGTINVANDTRTASVINTPPTASAITFGQTLADSILSGGTATPSGGVFNFTTPATAPNAGTASQGITYTPADLTAFTTATGTTSVTVNQATQTISFGALGNKNVGDSDFAVNASGGASGNPVTFASQTAGVCTTGGLNGSNVHLVAAGLCTIRASQAGNTNYSAASPSDQSFNVIQTYTLTYMTDGNGTISGTAVQTVPSGGSGTQVTAVPNAGYQFVNWSDASTSNPRTDTNVTADATYTANFAAAPTITTTGIVADFGSVTVGNISSEKTYTVAGANLTNDIVVTAPSTDFQVSKTTSTGFGNSITFTRTGGTVATSTVFVRFTPQGAGVLSGDITNASANAATQNVAVSGTGVAAACVTPPSGMVAWLPGDGYAIDIFGPNDGTLHGNAAYGTGKVGQAFDLDGFNSLVSFNNFNIPSGSSARTIDMWVNTRDASPNRELLVYGDQAFHRAFGIDMDGTDGAGNVMLQMFTYGDDLSQIPTDVPINQWMHIAVTYDGAVGIKIYVNGVLKATLTLSGQLSTGASDVTIGHFTSGYFNGLVDEIEFFGRELSPTEIGSIYNAGTAGKCKTTAPEITVQEPAGTDRPDNGVADSFGSRPVSSVSPAKTFTIRNTGTTELSIGAFTKDGTEAADYTLNTSGTAGTLPPHTSTTFTVTFTPGGVGTRDAAIHFVNGDADETPFDINLTGTGIVIPPASLVVNTNDDQDLGACTPSPGHCSLREAITGANVAADINTISFDAGVTGNITPATPLPNISQNLVINGPGANVLTIQGTIGLSGNKTVSISALRIANSTAAGINGSAVLTLDSVRVENNQLRGINVGTSGAGVTVSNSKISGNTGGGIVVSSGPLTMTDVIVEQNSNTDLVDGAGVRMVSGGGGTWTRVKILQNTSANANGGGAYAGFSLSPLTIVDSQFSGNTSRYWGGGLYLDRQITRMRNTLISGNTTTDGIGGGVYTENTSLSSDYTFINITVTGNTATAGCGGGIAGHPTLINSTIAFNHAGAAGGGIFGRESNTTPINGRPTLKNTIVTGNTDNLGNQFGDSAGDGGETLHFKSLGYNIISKRASSYLPDYVASDFPDGTDPLLTPLGSYGGPTQTFALRAASPAINAGDNCVLDNTCSPTLNLSLTTDQRGIARPQTSVVDIGAFEAKPGLTLSPGTLPNGNIGNIYNQTITPGDGTSPYTIVVGSGSVPTGLTLSTDGVLSGTPTANGTFNFTAFVTDSNGTQGEQAYTVTIAPAPAVTSTSPSSGSALGGTIVVITGTNFTGATAVAFGGTAATTYAVDSATQITATSPAGSGTVDVTVTTPGGTSAISAGDQFTYTYTVTPSSSGNGTIAPPTPVSVNLNGTTSFTLTPATGYHIDTTTGTCGGSLLGNVFTTAAVIADCTVIANFAPSPAIALGQSSMTFGATLVGSPAADQTSSVTGSNLTANVSCGLTTGTDYLISSDNSTFGTSAGFAQTGGSVSGTLYVRFTPTAAGTRPDAVTCSSAGAPDQTISLTGGGYLATYIVNSNVDGVDASPGDGICETATGNNICTLRAAIQETNVLAGAQTITFAPSTNGTPITADIPPADGPAGGIDTSSIGDLDVTESLTITGNGAGNTIIQVCPTLGGCTFFGNTPFGHSYAARVFDVASGTFTMSGVTVRNGESEGGGINMHNAATLVLSDSTIGPNNGFGTGSAGIRLGSDGSPGSVATITNTTINGNRDQSGIGGGIGGIGTLTFTGGLITNNTAFQGGGIGFAGALTLTDSTLSGNTAGSKGAGIYLTGGASQITGSTISGNTATFCCGAADGGGIYAGGTTSPGFTIALTNSTISGNSANGNGGAIYDDYGQFTLKNVTITNNTAAAGTAVQRTNNGSISAVNTILDGTCSSTLTSLGYNLGTDTTNNSCGLNGTGDLLNASTGLGPLANNGGPTQTHSLLDTSPALDQGSAVSGVTTDQRGQPRPHNDPNIANAIGGDGSDIGAYENQVDVVLRPTVTGIAPNSGPAAGGTSVTITGTNFTGVTAVAFGGTAATYTVDTVTQITATSPAGSGIVDMTVTTPGGTSAISAGDQFTYTYTVTPSSSGNGTIAPPTPVSVNYNGTTSFTLTPATGYHVDTTTGTCGGSLLGNVFTTAAVTADCTVIANFAINTYTVTPSSSGNGTIAPPTPVSVNYNGTTSFTLTPATGYHIDTTTGTCGGSLLGNVFTTAAVIADCTVIANFAIDTYTITATAGANGSIAPNGATTVNFGGSQAYTITADAHYHIADVLVDGVSVGAVGTYTFSSVSANHTIAASFAIDIYTITATAGSNGSIAPAGATVVSFGGSQAYTITPDAHYHIADVLVDGSSVGAVGTYTFSSVSANHAISASFAIDTYTITATAGANGSIAPSGATIVNFGGSQAYTITPATHYHIADVQVDGVSVGTVGTYTFSSVSANHTISGSFAIDTFTITATAGANGSISPSGAVTVNYDGSQSFTITPVTGYHIADVLVDGVTAGAVASYTFSNVSANHTIAASFAINTYTITATAGSNGTIAPAGATVVNFGGSQTYTFTPTANYHIADVLIDGASVGAVGTYTFSSVSANHTISASFAIDTYTITATAGANGSIAPAGATVVGFGSSQAYTITAALHYHITGVLVDGVSVGAAASYTFSSVSANHTIAASFAIDTNTITATAGSGGSITPAGAVAVNYGANQSFSITPDPGFTIADVLVDGVSAGAVSSYTFTNVTAAHSIAASFVVGAQASTVYVDDDWVGLVNGTDPDGSGPATSIGYDAFATVQGGVAGVAANGDVIVHPGTYTGNIDVDRVMDVHGVFTLNGSLTVSAAGASVSPGFSPGIINTGDFTMTPGTTLNIELSGTTPGTQHDQVNVTGAVNLGGGNLVVTLGPIYSPSPGQSYRIIDNDGVDPVTGTFNGLAQGDVFFIGPISFQIDYAGGTGNDVVLTTVAFCNDVSMPANITTLTATTVNVPVNTDDVTGHGLLSFDTTINYDPAVLTSPTVNLTAITSGGLLSVNSSTPGVLVISVFRGTPFAGTGALLNIGFNVIGLPAATSPMTFAAFQFNEGTLCLHTTNGSVKVISGTISGTVLYGNPLVGLPAIRPVPNVGLSATGSIFTSSMTDSSGLYSLSGMGGGSYTVTPAKSGDVNGAVTGFDAARIAQHVIGLGTALNANQLLAADVSGTGGVTSFDAALIARYTVALSVAGSTGTWKFVPASRAFANVNASHPGSDFTAILMGDVSGNWNYPASNRLILTTDADRDAKPVRITMPRVDAPVGADVIIPIAVQNIAGKGIVSYEFDLGYDANVIMPQQQAAALDDTVSAGMAVAVNVSAPGLLKVVVYGTTPLGSDGSLLVLRFNAVGTAGAVSPLTLQQFKLNEGEPALRTIDGGVLITAAANDTAISGRLLTAMGQGVANSRVTLTDTAGVSRTVMSSSLGYYSFGSLQIGQTYTIRVESRQFVFQPITVSVTGSITNVDVIAEP